MKSKVKVSICIPTYNQTDYFEKTLRSVLVQDYKNYEIIITDDSDSDVIYNIVQNYLPNDKIHFFKNKIPKGAPENWNEAIFKSSGEYIKILHHDDWFTEINSLSKFVKALDDNQEVDFCFSSTQIRDAKGRYISNHSVAQKKLIELEQDPTMLFMGNIIGAPSVTIYRKTILEKYDSNMKWLVDLDLYIRILEKHKFIYLKEPLIATTSNATHQVTYTCQNNKTIEVFEYIYLYNKIHNRSKQRNELLKYMKKIFNKYHIFTLKDLDFLESDIKIIDDIKKLLKPNFINKNLKKIGFTYLKQKGIFLQNYLQFQREFAIFKATHGERFSVESKDKYLCLNDKSTTTGFDKHYIYHTAWAARKLKDIAPKKHIDISSFTYFSTIVSAFIPIDFYDYRPAKIKLDDFSCEHIDITSLPFENNSIDSLSCMHVVEHIGLGRYGDPLDVNGDLIAISELKRVVSENGNLLFVVPIGKAKIMFNAHRIYSYDQIISYFEGFELKEFTLIPDQSNEGLIVNATKEHSDMQNYACGCFWLKRIKQ